MIIFLNRFLECMEMSDLADVQIKTLSEGSIHKLRIQGSGREGDPPNVNDTTYKLI